MDSFEFSKIAGAVLCALLAIVLPKTLMQMRAESAAHEGHGEKFAGYTLPLPAEATAAGKAVAGKPGAVAAAETKHDAGKADAAPMPLASASGAAAAGAGGIFDTVKPMLASAKPEGGAATFKVCSACHSGEKGGANKVGPVLWGVVGRKTGSIDGFNYSDAMKNKGGEWTYDRLAGFLSNPKGYVAGTKMVYNGVQDPEKLAELLAYLATLSDSPVPMPK